MEKAMNVNFQTALALIARGYSMRYIDWPEDDLLRRSVPGEPMHPTLVRLRSRISDTPALEYRPFITDEQLTGKWVFAKRGN